jgi:hypothetical protein
MPFFKRRKTFGSRTDTIKKKAFGQICSEEEFTKIIENERARAERNDHSFSLILFDTAAIGLKPGTIEQFIHRISCRIRQVDQIGWYDDQRIGLILPYTSNVGACQLVAHICNDIEKSYSPDICHVTTYPLDRTLAQITTQPLSG